MHGEKIILYFNFVVTLCSYFAIIKLRGVTTKLKYNTSKLFIFAGEVGGSVTTKDNDRRIVVLLRFGLQYAGRKFYTLLVGSQIEKNIFAEWGPSVNFGFVVFCRLIC